MKKVLYYLPSIIFNLAESLVIILIGFWLNLNTKEILMILLLFSLTRMRLGGAMHYKDWYKCLIWSTLVFLSLFIVAHTGMILSIIMTIFCAYILTGKGNINDTFLWKGKDTKYEDIVEFIKYNTYDDKLLEFESKIKEKDKVTFLIYKYRFKENKTFSEICDLLDINDNAKIVKELDKLAFSLRIYCGI